MTYTVTHIIYVVAVSKKIKILIENQSMYLAIYKIISNGFHKI